MIVANRCERKVLYKIIHDKSFTHAILYCHCCCLSCIAPFVSLEFIAIPDTFTALLLFYNHLWTTAEYYVIKTYSLAISSTHESVIPPFAVFDRTFLNIFAVSKLTSFYLVTRYYTFVNRPVLACTPRW